MGLAIIQHNEHRSPFKLEKNFETTQEEKHKLSDTAQTTTFTRLVIIQRQATHTKKRLLLLKKMAADSK